MERDGESRALVQLEICQFEREFEQCKEDVSFQLDGVIL